MKKFIIIGLAIVGLMLLTLDFLEYYSLTKYTRLLCTLLAAYLFVDMFFLSKRSK